MLTFEQTQDALTEIADRIPQAIFSGLNGGIILLPEVQKHPEDSNGSLLILGQYRYEPMGFGRYIVIYYGSFCHAHGHLTEDEQIKKLEEVLFHELIHHLENQAGDKSLELQDARDIARYKKQFSQRENGGNKD